MVQRFVSGAFQRVRRAWRENNRHFRFRVVWAIGCTVLWILWFIILPPIASAIVYQTVAPPGWHNVTIHGRYAHYYAVSPDVPGLMLACGEEFTYSWLGLHSESHAQLWRTRDGGAHWETIRTPFTFFECQPAAPLMGNGTFFVGGSGPLNGSSTLWVSHNAGVTWRAVITLPANSIALDQAVNSVAGGIYRDERLYTLRALQGNNTGQPKHFSVSTNDGATWTVPEIAPSALERAGWDVFSFAADYSTPHAWFRELQQAPDKNISPAMLERSVDDGRTWTVVGSIGAMHAGYFSTLGTSPMQPGRLCASVNNRADTGGGDSLAILTSADNGYSWHTSTTPSGFPRASGFTPQPVRMGRGGDCYLVYVYELFQHNTFRSIAWRSAPGQSTLQALTGLRDYGGDVGDTVFTYVPAGNGLPSHLVASVSQYATSSRGVIDLWAAEEVDNLLIWAPVP